MESTNKPEIVNRYYVRGLPFYDVNFSIVDKGDMWEYNQVTITSDKWNYGGIVDVLIRYYYPNDVMQAVINNYLLEPENEYYVSEFNKMQSWRKEAKEIAKQVMEYELY